MLIQILILIVSLAIVGKGADIMVDGASSIARRYGISDFIIGLTIVGMGTSAPELVISLVGAISGSTDVSVGNVIGSNIFNTLLIGGISALICPMVIARSNKKTDIPFNILAVAAMILLGMNFTLFHHGTDALSRIDGIVLLLMLAAYIFVRIKSDDGQGTESVPDKDHGIWKSVLMVTGGLVGLVLGGRLFVDSATAIARALNVSDKFIALTIIAGGTSLPELSTCIASAVKKNTDMAMGNIIGSNIFNILLILGASSLITPLPFDSVNWVDLGVLALGTTLLLTSVWTGWNNKVDRFDGALMLLCFAGYYVYLFMNI